jgi:hypothetical protein
MDTKNKIKTTVILTGILAVIISFIPISLTFVLDDKPTGTKYPSIEIQEIDKLRYDYIVTYGNDKVAIGKDLKNKIKNLPSNEVSADMANLLKTIN